MCRLIAARLPLFSFPFDCGFSVMHHPVQVILAFFVLIFSVFFSTMAVAQTDPPPNSAPIENASPSEPEVTLPFNPSEIGLPGFRVSASSAEESRQLVELIDTRIRAEEAALVGELEADADVARDADLLDSDTPDTPDTTDAEAVRRRERFIAGLRELRAEVARNAVLGERLVQLEQALEYQQTRENEAGETADTIATADAAPSIAELDRQRAELALAQGLARVAETRLQGARRAYEELGRALSTAERERRSARDRLSSALAAGADAAEHAALADALRQAQLDELLVRERLAAAEQRVTLARLEGNLTALEQQALDARIALLEPRAHLTLEELEQRLADLAAEDAAMARDSEDLLAVGDRAEADLRAARLALDTATSEDERALREEWIAAHQSALDAARSSIDSLTSARGNLAEMERLWTLRYQLMHEPDALHLPDTLARLMADTALSLQEKEAVETRLNALRGMQLAQQRRLREPGLAVHLRAALEARGAALEMAERNGRRLLGTLDALTALKRGLRAQLEPLIEQQKLALRLARARETLAAWWGAEVVSIDDQSIRVRELIVALAMFVVVLAVVSLLRIGARRALKRLPARGATAQRGDLGLVLSAIAGNTNQGFVLIVAFYVAMAFSGLASVTIERWLWNLVVIAFYAQIGIWANAALVGYFERKRSRQELRDPSTVTGYGLLMFFLRIGIWITMGVSLLAYFKYPIAGLVGALGVGSLAVAFAVQNILGDVFSSMAIILDKPFRVGDFIKAGDTLGVVENIGVKTTRIRSLSGERVVLSNSDLLGSRIHNFKHFKERRVVFKIGVVYDTPRARLEEIPGMLRAAIEEQRQTRFDRAHFVEYGDFALSFEVVYFVLSPDFGDYMDVQQGINLGIHRRFEEAGVRFAYPTQEVILRRA